MRKAITLVLVLLLATSPVAAATLIHTDDTELGSGSTTNATISGTGDSASVEWPTNVTTTLDGFEDGDASDWYLTQHEVNTASAHDGQYGLEFYGSSSYYTARTDIPDRRYGGVSAWIKQTSDDNGLTDIKFGSPIQFRISRSNTLQWNNGSSWVDTGQSVPTGSWHRYEVTDIDYGSGEYDLSVYDNSGNKLTTVTGQFTEPASKITYLEFESSDDRTFYDTIVTEVPAETGSYTSAEYDLTNPTNGFVDISTISNSEATVKWQYNSGSGWQTETTNTYTTAGNKSTSLATSADRWRVQVDFTNTSATDYYAEIADEGVQFDNSAPALSGASPTGGEQISTTPVTLEINVTDSEFGTAQGDSVEVEFRDASDDSVIGTDTLAADGTASVQWSDAFAGQNSWYAVATDSYGAQTTSSTYSFTTPSQLYIRNETQPSQLVNGSATVTVRFYNDDTVIRRTTSDGTVDLAGLPQQQLVAVVETDDYYTRRVVIDSLYDQNSVYLLNKSETAVYNEFFTDDQTGRFDSATTRLYIEKAITQDGSTEWQVIAGDYLGASSSFPANLQQDARYRLSVENDDGDSRILGAYTAAREGTVTLTIGAIEWQAPTNETIQWETFLDEDGNIQIQFEDPQDQTTDFDVSVHERNNESNVIYQDSQASLGTYDASVPLTANQSSKQWVVEWSATRNGEQIGATNPIGGVSSLPLPVDSRWLTIGSLWLLVGFAALFPSASARTGAIVIVAIAAGLSWMGWAPIPFVAVGLAGAIALLGKVADWRGDY